MKLYKASLFLLGLAFCLSGIASLIYQVAWQRILILHSGVGIYSVSVVVSAFMAGLGFGSYFGGKWSSKAGKQKSLTIFAVIELSIGLIGLISCFVYYDLLYMNANWLYSSLLTMIPTHFVTLILPTFLMGMSLPFLVHGTIYNYKNASSTIGVLYGINIIGAVIGAFATPWLLIPYIGIQGAVYLAAGANFVAGTMAYLAGRRIQKNIDNTKLADLVQEDAITPTETNDESASSFNFWVLLYTISGFIALALEILWFRILDVAVKSNAFTFGTILAIYLLGLGLGTFIGSKFSRANNRPLRSFLIYQSGIIIYSCLAIMTMSYLPEGLGFMEVLDKYWGGKALLQHQRFYLHIVLGFYYCLVPTIFMGLSFTVLQKAVHNDGNTIGEKVGVLQAFNILGNVLGSLAIGLVLIEYFGTSGSLRILSALGLFFPVIGVIKFKKSPLFMVLSAIILVLVFAIPNQGKLWSRFHGVPPEKAIYSEKVSGLVGLVELNQQGAYYYYINGKYHSSIPFGGTHSFLGALAAILHPNPTDVAIIGLGTGDTAWAAGCRAQSTNIVVYEIVLAEDMLTEMTSAKKLQSFFQDERYNIIEADGRNALALSDARYDIIEADALRPQSAYAGNLYSYEYFDLCRSRLKEDGIMVQWNSSPRVQATFCAVFPNVYKVGPALIGTESPLRTNKWMALARIEESFTKEYLGANICKAMTRSIEKNGITLLTEAQKNTGYAINRDLFPKDEFRLVNHLYYGKEK